MEERHRELTERIEELERALEALNHRRGRFRRLRAAGLANPWLRPALASTILLIPLAAYASTLNVPNSFVNGTTADANEVNANFAAVEAAVNDNHDRISTLESGPAPGDITGVSAGSGLSGGGLSGNVTLFVDTNTTQTRVTGTCAVGSSIRSIAANGTVTCEADDVGAGGDITDVLAGTGLAGGGSSGSVSLSVATGGINSSLIQDGSITGIDVQDGSLSGADIQSTTFATLGGLTVNGSAGVSGTLDVNELHINNSNANLRLFDSAGTTELSRLFSQSADKYFYDFGQGRYVFRSNSNGVGIGTSPSVGADVTIASLQVTGTTTLGYQRVTSTYSLISSGTCHSAGNLTCYYGTGTAVCPAGKKALGGGLIGSSARFASIGYSYPSADDRWSCASSYDSPSTTHTCYVVCARVD